jgi:YesN/AraC family two-component response regulator
MESTTILIADDSGGFRSGLLGMLQTAPGLQVVGEAKDGERAVLLTRQHQPDLVLMDINMPRLIRAVSSGKIIFGATIAS